MKILLVFIFFMSYFVSFGQTEEICENKAPKGWIVIDSRVCVCCGVEAPVQNRIFKIQRIDNLPVGTALEICPNQKIPEGWVVISIRVCRNDCCGINAYRQMKTIKKI